MFLHHGKKTNSSVTDDSAGMNSESWKCTMEILQRRMQGTVEYLMHIKSSTTASLESQGQPGLHTALAHAQMFLTCDLSPVKLQLIIDEAHNDHRRSPEVLQQRFHWLQASNRVFMKKVWPILLFSLLSRTNNKSTLTLFAHDQLRITRPG